MQRTCDCCGTEYEGKRRTSRFCSPKCRVQAHRQAKLAVQDELQAPAAPPAGPQRPGVAAAVERELAEASKLDSAYGQAALVLAARIDGRQDTGSAVASMVKEMRATLESALVDQPPAADPMDEIAKARATRLARLTGA